jgi:hypothetical protein
MSTEGRCTSDAITIEDEEGKDVAGSMREPDGREDVRGRRRVRATKWDGGLLDGAQGDGASFERCFGDKGSAACAARIEWDGGRGLGVDGRGESGWGVSL